MRYATAVPIAAGATGRVVRAFDEERGEDVALKLLHRDDPAWVQRMLREAQVQMRLSHRHICAVYGTGRMGEQPYIAMRFVDGEAIDRAAAPLSDREKAALLAQVADAIAYAHGQGVVHRDLKPSNILVEARDGAPHVVIVDFGLVRDVDAPELTCTGQLLGTPGYMAPEQATAAASVDGRADIFSLGVVAFELIAGRRPFAGESAAEILLHTLRREPPSLQSLRPDIDPALARIVRQCLESDPDWRYPDAARLREDLLAFARGRRVSARADTPWRRMHRFARRHPWRTALGGAAAVLAVGVVGVALYGAWYAREQSVAAQRYMEFAAGVENAMRFESMKPAHDIAPARERLRARVDAFADALPDSGPAARRTGALALGRAYAAIGRRDAARAQLEAAHAAGDDSAALHAALGHLLLREYFDALQAAPGIANAELREDAIARLDVKLRTPARRHLARATRDGGAHAQSAQALLAWLDGDEASARRQLREAADVLDYPVDALLLAGDLAVAQALSTGLDGEPEAALAQWREAFDHYGDAADVARSHAGVAAAQCRVGGALVTMLRHGASVEEDEYRAAMAHCERAVALDSGSAAAHAARAQAQADLGLLLRRRGEWVDADFEPAIASARRALALDNGSIAARRALGALLTQRAYWQAEHAIDSRAAAAAAVRLLTRAQADDPGSPHGAMMLANAHAAAARAAVFGDGGDSNAVAMAHRLAAERVLREAIGEVADAPLILDVHLIDKLTWRGFDAYMAGGDPGASFDEAVARGRRLMARAPEHPNVGPALAMAAWTYGEYQAIVGEDARAMARLAADTYRRVLSSTSASVVSRFNGIGALQLVAELKLDRGESAAAELDEIDVWIARLLEEADEADVAIQLAAQAAHRASELALADADPRAHYAEARRLLELVFDNPIDAREGYVVLARLAAHEHAWHAAHGRQRPTLLETDVARLERAVAAHGDYATLQAEVATMLAALPADAARLARARELLGDAFARMPALRGGYAALASRLQLGAHETASLAPTP